MSNKLNLKAAVYIQSKQNLSEITKSIETLNNELPQNCELVLAHNFNQLVEILSKTQVDFLILEWIDNDKNFLELINKMHSSKKYHKTPILYINTQELNHQILPHFRNRNDLQLILPYRFQDIKFCFQLLPFRLQDIVLPSDSEVLILDNKQEILEIMSGFMKELNHPTYTTCKSIAEAQTIVDKKDFDILILDWNLKDGTCLEFIEYVRYYKKSERLNDALIMVITGRDNVDDIITLLKYNVLDHIIKPFNFDEFEEKISYAIERNLKKKNHAFKCIVD